MYAIIKYFGVECICVDIFGLIFYWRCLVGGVVNCTGVIYGVRTSLFLTSQRMPAATDCAFATLFPAFAGSYIPPNLRGYFDEKRLD